MWTVPPPSVDPDAARAELLRRFLAALGPATATGFATWAGLTPADARATWEVVAEPPARNPAPHDAPVLGVRLLPPGDLFLQAPDRDLLVPDAARRAAVWPWGTPQPGALLVDGELAGTWRRRGHRLEVAAFDHPSEETRRAAEEEAAGFPLGLARPIEVRWTRP